MATGMTLSLCITSLRESRTAAAKYVLWSRVDQKSCFKSILVANCVPIIIDTIQNSTTLGLETDVTTFETKIDELGAENIVCIMSTTSCFAPRECDDVLALAKLAFKHNIPHLINNAYGLQSRVLCQRIQQAGSGPERRVDLFVQSTDKNLMVPVGGAIVSGFDSSAVANVANCYAGRASSGPTLDVLMTLLSLGKNRYLEYVTERESTFVRLKAEVELFYNELGADYFAFLKIDNPISVAISMNCVPVSHLNFDLGEIGSMLFVRGVSGTRYVAGNDTNHSIEGYNFKGSYFLMNFLVFYILFLIIVLIFFFRMGKPYKQSKYTISYSIGFDWLRRSRN